MSDTTQLPATLTLEAYARAKKLDPAKLRGWGVSEYAGRHGAYVRIAYIDQAGAETAVRKRSALDGPNRFTWNYGAKPGLYGLNLLGEARRQDFVVIVEGESDCHTLWQAGFPAVGLPGAGQWREARDAKALDGIAKIYVVNEGDSGGDTMLTWLAKSEIRHRAHLIDLAPPLKDPSALYLDNPQDFAAAFAQKIDSALAWTAREQGAAAERQGQAYALAAALARTPDILAAFRTNLKEAGLVGEDRNAAILYLTLTSRLLMKPVSVAYKGPSSGGKSYAVERVLAHFPDDAVVSLTSMSEKALIFIDEELAHKHLIIAEAEGAAGELQSYLIRSLLSEGRLEHRMADKTPDGIVGRHIVKQGPTGLILTTTKVSLHPENETRMISLTANDTREQTSAVLQAVAGRNETPRDIDGAWPALQTWLAHGERRVAVPFAKALAGLVSNEAVRMRRDFAAVLSLVEAHALLHRANRERDAAGRIVASLDDYAAVRALIFEVIAEGIAVTVQPTVRQAVDAVRELAGDGSVLLAPIAKHLKIDKSSAARRCYAARLAGYLINEETMRGREARYRVGETMPADAPVLPTPEALRKKLNGEATHPLHPLQNGCAGAPPPNPRTGAPNPEGIKASPPPSPTPAPRWSIRI